jgi:hypothetical protein
MRQPTRLVILAAIAASLTACGSNSDTSNQVITPVSPTPVTATANISVSSLGVENISEIKFIPTVPSQTSANGYFDVVNNATEVQHALPKTGDLRLAGWAAIGSKQIPAEQVIITQGEQNEVIAIAPVKVARPDLLTFSPNYKNAGWETTVEAAKLPGNTVVLKAWAYDASEETAFQLNKEHTVNFATETGSSDSQNSPGEEATPSSSDQP